MWTTVGKGIMKKNRDKGKKRILKIALPKHSKVMDRRTNGMAGRAAD
jgi:hypothetical protein